MDGELFDTSSLDGDPAVQALYEHPQHEQEDCVEASAADVIDQLTGDHLTDVEVADFALTQPSIDSDPSTGLDDDPMYEPDSGTELNNLPDLLADYGVHATYTDTTTAAAGGPATGIDALADQLSAGNHVIVGVDAITIWDALGKTDTTDPHELDHAVVVTGIDTADNVVYLNDSGVPNGAAEAVPLDVFLQAWNTGGDQMVVTDGTSEPSSDGSPDSPADDAAATGLTPLHLDARVDGAGADVTPLHPDAGTAGASANQAAPPSDQGEAPSALLPSYEIRSLPQPADHRAEFAAVEAGVAGLAALGSSQRVRNAAAARATGLLNATRSALRGTQA